MTAVPVAARSPLTFGQVTRVREFRWLWLADVQSLLGDQLARVALSVLVYERTRSSVLTAGTYALTFIPALAGSFLLGHLADRVPRRALLVLGDLLRAGLLALMAIPGTPLAVMTVLLVASVIIGTPWKAAESALVADILAGEGYVLGAGLRFATSQGAQLIGFAAGGAAVAAIGSRPALGIDALTFLISAVFIRLGVQKRPAAAGRGTTTHGRAGLRSWLAGVAMITGRPELRSLLGLSWLAGLFVVPEGLAAPYAAALHGGPRVIGLLLAATPAGTLVGAVLLTRFVGGARRGRLVGPLAIVAGIPLALCALQPGLLATIVLWALTGACVSYQIQIITEYVAAVDSAARGQAIGLLTSGLLAVQGLGLLGAGLLSQWLDPATAIAWCGVTAVALAVPAAWSRRRHNAPVDPAPRVTLAGSGWSSQETSVAGWASSASGPTDDSMPSAV